MAGESGDIEIIQNEDAQRFEVHLDGHVGFLEYVRDGDIITYPHTEVPRELGGRGLAGRLATHALDYARANNLRVNAVCPFVKKYVEDHAEYHDLVAK